VRDLVVKFSRRPLTEKDGAPPLNGGMGGRSSMPSSFYIWTIGCQMNTADSERLGSALEQMGLKQTSSLKSADIVVLNSCVVRQNAEDKVAGLLSSIKPVKLGDPSKILALMGCMVGPRTHELEKRFPYVDAFMRPQEYQPLLDIVSSRLGIDWEGCLGPLVPSKPSVSAYMPVIHGCDLMCTFCIIPYRRGRQVSKPIPELVLEAELLVSRGVREIVLLGQTVDAYGADLPGGSDLADLMYALHAVSGIDRIRFLTSHPIFMSDRILRAIRELPKVCEQLNLPVQAGSDSVLEAMGRRYSRSQYLSLIDRVRLAIPGVAISTDVIVGFCGETDEQFQSTYDLLREVEFDKVHVAAYSPRPGTIAWRRMEDSVTQLDKTERLKRIEELQERVAGSINSKLLGQETEILVDGYQKGKWRGRTRTEKLVFFAGTDSDLYGQLVRVRITDTGPWSMQGVLV